MLRRLLLLVPLLAACSDKKADKAPPAPPPLPLTITDEGLGPITATTPATVDAISALLPAGLTAKSAAAPGLEGTGMGDDVRIHAGDTLVAIIIPGDDGNVYAMRVVSPRIVSDRGWRTGTTITDPAVVAGCSCMGDGLACYRKNGRVGVILDEDCQTKYMDGDEADVKRYRGLSRGDDTALATLRGKKVVLLTWSRERFTL